MGRNFAQKLVSFAALMTASAAAAGIYFAIRKKNSDYDEDDIFEDEGEDDSTYIKIHQL